jgi:hypothetical protein
MSDAKMKVSEWLKTTVDSHAIQSAAMLQADYEAKTGKTDKLPSHGVKETERAIDARGLGGSVEGKPFDRVTWGWEVAEALANVYGDRSYNILYGRGSRFHMAIASIADRGN